MKTLTFSNTITEDIYLKLRVVVHYQKGCRGGNPPIFFITKLCPFFDLEFSKCSYSRALAPACGALVQTIAFQGQAYGRGHRVLHSSQNVRRR